MATAAQFTDPQQPAPLQFTQRDGRHLVGVPWADAKQWQLRLRQAGIRSTLVSDPLEHRAYLELWATVDAARAGVVLAAPRG